MKSRATWIIAAGLGIVIAVAAVVALTASSDQDESVAGTVAEFQDVSISGDALPGFQGPDGDAAVGLRAPVLDGSGFAGNEVSTKPGTPTLVVFLAHWCPHCQREVPELVKMNDNGMLPPNLDVIAVTTSTDPSNPNFPPSQWLAREQWPLLWPVLVDDASNSAAQAFGVAGFPFMVLLDADGAVVWRRAGSQGAEQLAALLTSTVGS